MPNVFCVLFVCAHTLRLGDTADKTKGLQLQVTTKAWCKIHLWIHIQSNVIVLIKYINVFPNFTVPDLEMFLDRTDLSKTVDRHGTERCHVLSRSSRFLVAVLLNGSPFLRKTAENGKNRP